MQVTSIQPNSAMPHFLYPCENTRPGPAAVVAYGQLSMQRPNSGTAGPIITYHPTEPPSTQSGMFQRGPLTTNTTGWDRLVDSKIAFLFVASLAFRALVDIPPGDIFRRVRRGDPTRLR